jgi:hypothetical protein
MPSRAVPDRGILGTRVKNELGLAPAAVS